MRDSHIGAMGVITLFFVLTLKSVALAQMNPVRMAAAVFVMPVAGRVAILLMMHLLSYARDEGCAAVFYKRKPIVGLTVGTLTLLLVAVGGCQRSGFYAVLAAFLMVVLFAWQCKRKIGGSTGDTLGAACELAETAVVVTLAIV